MGPLWHYPLGEASGNLHSRVGAAPPLVSIGTAAFTYGQPGLVTDDDDTCVLGHSNNRYKAEEDPVFLLSNGSFSVFILLAYTITTLSTVVALRRGATFVDISLLITTGRHFPGEISCESWAYENESTRCRTEQSFADGLPHVGTVTYNAKTGALSLWVDGVLYDTRFQPLIGVRAGGHELYLANNSVAGQGYGGRLDELIAFPYELPPAQIRQLAHAARSHLTWPALHGSAITTMGTPAQKVVVRDWYTHQHRDVAVPKPNGAWASFIEQGTYDVTYFAPGCAPACHGPYGQGGG